jgi:hypothetical protein
MLRDLADDWHDVANAGERRQVWSEVRRRLVAPGIRSAFFARLVSRLPPPPPSAVPELAHLLVAATWEGRLSPRTFATTDEWGNYRPWPSTPEAIGWRSALREQIPTDVPGREWIRAMLLESLGAEREQVLQAWRAVETSPTATPAQAAEALEYLLRHESTREWASTRLARRLSQAADRTVASTYLQRVWGEPFMYLSTWDSDEKEKQRRSDVLEAAWQQISRLRDGSPARAAALQTLFARTRFAMDADGLKWLARATAALGTSDAAADEEVLDYLARMAPDISAQTLPCALTSLYEVSRPRESIDETLRIELASRLRPLLDGGGESGDAALRVWRGFNLPADADIDARVRKAEGAMAAACPVPGSAATLADLAGTLALQPGDATRPARFAEVLNARSADVACKAAVALPAMGADAVPGASATLGELLHFTADLPSRRMASCANFVRFDTVFARGLAGLTPEHRRAALRQALASDRPRPPDTGERRPLTRESQQPAWEPSPREAEASAMESGDWDRGSASRELLDALGDVIDDELLTALEARRPGPGWVLLAESHLLRETSIAPGGDREPEQELRVDPGARRFLPALARYWPALPATERTRLLPLLTVADPQDAAVRGMIDGSLEDPTGGERGAALRVASRLWPADPRLPALTHNEVVAQALSERLKARLDTVFDALRRPRWICAAGIDYGGLPSFPWPPPAGYRTPEPLRLDWFGPTGRTAGGWFDLVRRTMQALSPYFETGLFKGPPGGFALVARLERIDVTGRPFPGLARWTTEGQPKLDLGDLFGDLFLERPGYFRIVVFVVTDQPTFQADSGARLPDVAAGSQVMPPQLRDMRLDGKYLMALVYSFERRQGEAMHAWIDGSPSALQHLRAAGIWERLSGQR